MAKASGLRPSPGLLVAASIALLGATDPPQVLNGAAAFGDWRADTPGTRRKITSADLPPLSPPVHRTRVRTSAGRLAVHISRPCRAFLRRSLPKVWRTRAKLRSPDGDVFVAESRADRIPVLLAHGAEKTEKSEIFASRLDSPFGIAFYPPGPDPPSRQRGLRPSEA